MTDEIEARLTALGLSLPEAPKAMANYVPYVLSGGLLFIAGQVSRTANGTLITGKLGTDLGIEDGRKAAEYCCLNLLAQAKAALGSLDRIAQVVRLNGFVNAATDFNDHPAVVNGASDGRSVAGTRAALARCSRRTKPARRSGRRDRRHIRGKMMRAWLNRPIAHRGLHDAKRGIIENTATAFAAAVHCGYSIETDIRVAANGEPVIFHDKRLERLTFGTGRVAEKSVAALRAIEFRATADRILGLGEFLDLIGGRVPLFLEIKSEWGRDHTLEERVASVVKGYRGPAAVMSFDPGSMAAMHTFAPGIPRGLSAMRYTGADWPWLTPLLRFRLTHMLAAREARPVFLTNEVKTLPLLAPSIRRRWPHLPLITWTVRTAEDRRKAARYADAMIFEGFRPALEPCRT
jgi:glycerophosphoryl diester phosphodiesterase/enamine deaminase RidA (YjgF/YER057c/UK114 family)